MAKIVTRKRLPLNAVIRFPKIVGGDDNACFDDYGYLKDHIAWAVIRVEKPSYGDYSVRLRTLDGRVAMTKWLCLYEDEFEIDPFLTAVNRAQKRAK